MPTHPLLPTGKIGRPWTPSIWTGRRLCGLFAGLEEFTGEIRANTLIETSFDPEFYGRRQAESFAALVRRNLIEERDFEEFMQFQTQSAASGAFMFSVTMYAFIGRKRSADDPGRN